MTAHPMNKGSDAGLPGKNPWPENSDYGKLWRRGYQDGCSDTTARWMPAMIRALTKVEDTE